MAISFLSGKEDTQSKIVALIDIGSASVGGALLVHISGKTPYIIYTTRRKIVFQEKLDFKHFIIAMLEALKQVLEDLSKNKKRPDICVCSLSSPWYAAETRLISIEKDKPFIVTANRLSKLIKKETEIFRENIKEKYPKEDVTLIQADALLVKLNGYPTSSPYGAFARKLDMSVYLSMSPTKVLDTIQSQIKKIIKCDDIAFHSFGILGVSTIRDMIPEQDTFVFIDVTGEVSDIALVKNDILGRSISFPYGTNTLIRKITEATKSVPEEAHSMLHLYLSGGLERTAQIRVSEIIKKVQKEWAEELVSTLENVPEGAVLPHAIFLTTDNSVAKIFKDALELNLPEILHESEDMFRVNFLGEKILDPFVSYAPDIKRDAFMSLGSIFTQKTLHT